MIKYIILYIIFIYCSIFNLFGQDLLPDVTKYRKNSTFQDPYQDLVDVEITDAKPEKPKETEINFIMTDEVSQIEELYKSNQKQVASSNGYRIQIYSGKKSGVNQVKMDFLKLYHNFDIYVDYHKPVFKVRIGDFKSMSEAEKICKEIKLYFSTAFVVPDIININN